MGQSNRLIVYKSVDRSAPFLPTLKIFDTLNEKNLLFCVVGDSFVLNEFLVILGAYCCIVGEVVMNT